MVMIILLGGGTCAAPPFSYKMHSCLQDKAKERKPHSDSHPVIIPEGFRGGNLVQVLGPYFEGGSCQIQGYDTLSSNTPPQRAPLM